MSIDTSVTHKQFKKHLLASQKTVHFIAEMFKRHDYNVHVPKQEVAKVYHNRMKHVDHGDLYVWRDGKKRFRIEVKNISRHFTGRHDWPFGKRFIVCAKHSYDQASPKPDYYIVLSADRKYMAALHCRKTRDFWRAEKIPDHRYGKGYSQLFYVCNSNLAVWTNTNKPFKKKVEIDD